MGFFFMATNDELQINTSFTNDASNNKPGRSAVDPIALDRELNALAEAENETRVRLKMIQRDDGLLRDASVQVSALSRQVINLMGGFNLRGLWLPNEYYAVHDVVDFNGAVWVCQEKHNAGTVFEQPKFKRFGFSGGEDAALAASMASNSARSALASMVAAESAKTEAMNFKNETLALSGIIQAQAAEAKASALTARSAQTTAVAASTRAQNAAMLAETASQSLTLGETKTIDHADNAIFTGFYVAAAGGPEAGDWVIKVVANGDVVHQTAENSSNGSAYQRTVNTGTGVKTPWVSAGVKLSDLASTAGGKGVDLVAGASKTVPSISDLRAEQSGLARTVVVAGYYADKPGVGGGVFMADPSDKTTADDGVTVIVSANGTRWRRVATTLSPFDAGARATPGIDDADAFARLASAASVDLMGATYYLSIIPKLPTDVIASGATLVFDKQKYAVDSLFLGRIHGRLSIRGSVPVSNNITALNLESADSFDLDYYINDQRTIAYQVLSCTFAKPVTDGEIVTISQSTDRLLDGCFVLFDCDNNTGKIAIMTPHATSLTSVALPVAAKIHQTVIQCDKTAINLSNGNLYLNNLAITGNCLPVPRGRRGRYFDPAGNAGGISGIIASNAEIEMGSNVAVNGFSGTQVASGDCGTVIANNIFCSGGGRNGISAASSSKTYGQAAIVSYNLLDGCIAQDTSFGFYPSVRCIGNGRHGIVASLGASVNATSATLLRNGAWERTGDGLHCNNGTMLCIGAIAKNNFGSGIRAFGAGGARGTGVMIQNNDVGIKIEAGARGLFTGNVTNNTSHDLYIRSGSYLFGAGLQYTTSTVTANQLNKDGSLLQTTSTII